MKPAETFKKDNLAISTSIPETWVLPLASISIDPSQAVLLTQNQPALIVAQMLPSGTATVNVPVPVGSPSVAASLFGLGSMAERMVSAFFAINTTQELWVAPVADPTAGVAATGSLTFTAVSTQSGVIYLYIAGQLVSLNSYTTDTLATLATRAAASINALGTLPVTAAVDGTNTAKVNLTCKWLGSTGNDVQMSLNYLGLYGGQALPVGLGLTITQMSGGNGQPDVSGVIAASVTKNFVHVALPYNDTASLDDYDTEYGFAANGRWTYTRQQYGWIYNALRADYADALEWGEAHNSAVITTMLVEPTMPSPIWCVTAAYAAVGSYYLLDDPARPLQTLPLTGILPALTEDRFSQGELNVLAQNGLAIQAVNGNGVPAIVREAMQYQVNAYGQRDQAFGLLTVLSNLAALIQRLTTSITSKYPRHGLAPDGTKFGAGKAIVTPSIIKGELVSEMSQAVKAGLASDQADFIANLLVEIDDNNPNRVNVLWAPQLMGQLRQLSVVAQFRLLYSTLTS